MRETYPSRVVLGPTVLAAAVDDADDAARDTLDLVLEHPAVTLVASDALLDAAATIAADRTGEAAAAELRDRVADARLVPTHPPDDHPALASAYRANAAHLVTGDPDLRDADAAAALGPLRVSARSPAAFLRIFDPGALPADSDDG